MELEKPLKCYTVRFRTRLIIRIIQGPLDILGSDGLHVNRFEAGTFRSHRASSSVWKK